MFFAPSFPLKQVNKKVPERVFPLKQKLCAKSSQLCSYFELTKTSMEWFHSKPFYKLLPLFLLLFVFPKTSLSSTSQAISFERALKQFLSLAFHMCIYGIINNMSLESVNWLITISKNLSVQQRVSDVWFPFYRQHTLSYPSFIPVSFVQSFCSLFREKQKARSLLKF